MTVPFAFGVAAYSMKDWIPAHPGILIASITLLLLTSQTGGFSYALWTAGAYCFLYIGLFPGNPEPFRRIGDLSFGVYLYAFPIQQLVIHWIKAPSPLEVIAISTVGSIALAWLSWNFVERPFLGSRAARPARRSVPSTIVFQPQHADA